MGWENVKKMKSCTQNQKSTIVPNKMSFIRKLRDIMIWWLYWRSRNAGIITWAFPECLSIWEVLLTGEGNTNNYVFVLDQQLVHCFTSHVEITTHTEKFTSNNGSSTEWPLNCWWKPWASAWPASCFDGKFTLFQWSAASSSKTLGSGWVPVAGDFISVHCCEVMWNKHWQLVISDRSLISIYAVSF